MAKSYSMDLRDRVVRTVTAEGMSCHAAAARFGVAPSSAMKWLRRYRDTGSAAPGRMGGRRTNILSGATRDWLLERVRQDFTWRGLVAELGTRGVKVDYVQVWRLTVTGQRFLQRLDAESTYPRCADLPSHLSSRGSTRSTRAMPARCATTIRLVSTAPGSRAASARTRTGHTPTC